MNIVHLTSQLKCTLYLSDYLSIISAICMRLVISSWSTAEVSPLPECVFYPGQGFLHTHKAVVVTGLLNYFSHPSHLQSRCSNRPMGIYLEHLSSSWWRLLTTRSCWSRARDHRCHHDQFWANKYFDFCLFSLNRPHWADSVIESRCPSVCLWFCAIR